MPAPATSSAPAPAASSTSPAPATSANPTPAATPMALSPEEKQRAARIAERERLADLDDAKYRELLG